MNKRPTAALVVSGMLAALVALATMLLKLPVPVTQGYVHLGDALILFSALLIGPIAAPIGAIGSALADLMGGYSLYILPTLCIKAAVGYLAGRFAARGGSFTWLRCLVVFALAELLMVLGYALFETFVFGWAMAIGAVLPNLLQALFSVLLGVALLPVARRILPWLRAGGKPL